MPHVAHLLWSSLVLAACGRMGFETQLADGVATVNPMVAFETRCGEAVAASAQVSITNDGVDDLRVVARASAGFTVMTPTPMVITPGSSATLEIRPPAAVIGTDRPGDTKTGTLTLETNAVATTTVEVALVATVSGAELAVTDLALQPANLDLTGSSGACPIADFRLTNTGNGLAMVELSSSAEFIVTGFSGGLIDADSSVVFSLGANTSMLCSGAGTVTFTTTSGACTTTPSVLDATFTITGASSCMCS